MAARARLEQQGLRTMTHEAAVQAPRAPGGCYMQDVGDGVDSNDD